MAKVSVATSVKAKEDNNHGVEGHLSSRKFQQKQSKRGNQHETKAIMDALPTDGSENSYMSEYFEEETEIRPQGSDGAGSARHRHRAPNVKTSSRSVNRNKTSGSDRREISPTRESSFPLEVAGDIWTWLKGSLRFSRASYPLWKWVVLFYLTILGLSYLLRLMFRFVDPVFSPVCSIRIVRSNLPLCDWFPDTEMKALDVSKVATSQEGLTEVMDRVGENFDLARDMTGHEFAIRDLRIRVAASKLSRRKELAQELDSLSRYTKKTAKDLSRFTAKVSKSIDTVYTFDEYAVKTLEAIADRERNPPTLPGQILSALSPFNAFTPSIADQSEAQVKKLFISTADSISNKVQALIDDSFELGHNLDAISETLERIKRLTIDELGDIPQAKLLSAVWTYLAHPDDHEQQKSHTTLLADMEGFYKRSSFVMEETVAALNRIEAELGEFRDDYATPGLTLKDQPLEIIVALLRKSAQRLEAGKQKLEFIEERGARRKKGGSVRESTRTVHASLV